MKNRKRMKMSDLVNRKRSNWTILAARACNVETYLKDLAVERTKGRASIDKLTQLLLVLTRTSTQLSAMTIVTLKASSLREAHFSRT